MKFDRTFIPKYSVEEVPELPAGLPVDRHILFSGGRHPGVGLDGPLLRITPDVGEWWVGSFAFGLDSPAAITAAYACPQETMLCVVSRGRGYVVDTSAPTEWLEVPVFPVLAVHPVAAAGLLLLCDDIGIVAYGEHGRTWQNDAVSWDGLKITRITPDEIHGTAWDAPKNQDVPFVLTLLTGKTVRGVTPKSS